MSGDKEFVRFNVGSEAKVTPLTVSQRKIDDKIQEGSIVDVDVGSEAEVLTISHFPSIQRQPRHEVSDSVDEDKGETVDSEAEVIPLTARQRKVHDETKIGSIVDIDVDSGALMTVTVRPIKTNSEIADSATFDSRDFSFVKNYEGQAEVVKPKWRNIHPESFLETANPIEKVLQNPSGHAPHLLFCGLLFMSLIVCCRWLLQPKKSNVQGCDAEQSSTSFLSEGALPPRPVGAVGTFLRVVTINDVYDLKNYARAASAVRAARASAKELDCVVTSHLNGDFLSPCVISALDGGRVMMQGLNVAEIDYVCLGNHEFDMGFDTLRDRLKLFKGKCINSNISNPQLSHLPRYHTVKVGYRTALLAGFCTDDVGIYLPKNRPTAVPIIDACIKVWNEAQMTLGLTPDVFLPMTHQDLQEDLATAQAFSDHPQLESRTPVILAGHDHTPSYEMAGNTMVVKVGLDAENIGIVDIWWTADGTLNSSCTVKKAAEFPEEPVAAAFVAKQKAFLEDSMGVAISWIPEQCSSRMVRYEPSGVATFLMDQIKRGLASNGVELVLIHGGAVRGKADYKPGPFTMGNLYAEFGFPTEQAIVEIKGQIIADSIRNSRSGEGEKPCFLHTDSGAVVSDNHHLVTVNNQPLDPEKTYRVSIISALLKGMNVIEPLYSWTQANIKIPDDESCRPAKDIIVEVCMKDTWRKLLGYDKWDSDGDGSISSEELDRALDDCLSHIDVDRDGFIDEAELRAFVDAKGLQSGLIALLIQSLDSSSDGKLSRDEFVKLAH